MEQLYIPIGDCNAGAGVAVVVVDTVLVKDFQGEASVILDVHKNLMVDTLRLAVLVGAEQADAAVVAQRHRGVRAVPVAAE